MSNVHYHPLPDRNINAHKSFNITATMQPTPSSPVVQSNQSPLNNTATTTSSSSILCNKVHIPINSTTSSLPSPNNSSANTSSAGLQPQQQQPINTEEFAKLDALLEDLLAEVEQPILLNKTDLSYTSSSNSWINNGNVGKAGITITNSHGNNNGSGVLRKNAHLSSNINDIERSVDWLNEQKEVLRSRKFQHSSVDSPSQEIHLGEQQQQQQPYRRVKTKLDYYLSSSNNNGASPSISYTTSSSNKPYALNDESSILSSAENGVMINNKPPVSPNNRMMYSPTSYLQQQQQQTVLLQPQTTPVTNNGSFRSLSTNPVLIVGGFFFCLRKYHKRKNVLFTFPHSCPFNL